MKEAWSGHQSGVDIAAIDAAMKLGYATGGWAPKGRKCEGGTIPSNYNVQETETAAYIRRTLLNIKDTDITVVFVQRPAELKTGGTFRTIEACRELGKSVITIDFSKPSDPHDYEVFRELLTHYDKVNFAGPRESKSPDIYIRVYNYMIKALATTNPVEEL